MDAFRSPTPKRFLARNQAWRALRFLALPIAVGAAVGFAVLWGKNGVQPAGTGPGYADAVRRAAPAVVNIFARRPRSPLCALPRYRERCQRDGLLASALGSGVVVRSDGYILTNHHVVAGGDDIVVAFHDGGQALATLVGTDPITDLAVLKADGRYPAIERAASREARVGDVVLAIGNPFGIGQAVSQGIVSAKDRYGSSGMPYDDLIQTDAAINPGNSGGALVDSSGRLLGINTLIYSQSGGSDGIGFAIPVERAIDILDEIIEHGQALHGLLGVGLSPAPTEGAVGLTVWRVYRGTPAHQAGLRVGDVLLSINGEPATSARRVTQQVLDSQPGSRLSIRIRRNGAVRLLEAIAGLRAAGR